jgi:lipopolysaccharide/colanic/teichoic acid biosynthesis glycosyltransferase
MVMQNSPALVVIAVLQMVAAAMMAVASLFDLEYVRSWSLELDFEILAKTFSGYSTMPRHSESNLHGRCVAYYQRYS